MLARKYYDHGNLGLASLAALLGSGLIGCGASASQLAREAPRVPIAHISELPEAERAQALSSLPMLLEVRQGDRFPIDAVLDSTLLKLDTPGTWTVEALQPFYVLLRPEGPPLLSTDGVDFEQHTQNSFNFGFNAQKGQPVRIRLALRLRAAEPPR
ncbi:MAG TPA: hypothetical protein VFS67_02825 [Polyangiaceae bacterium]|jgi:hypothetical protein|nr:hypothetical protein [Polyangiaceae bacterium]